MSANEQDINPKHAKFIDNILSGMNRTQAALAAGITDDKNYAGVAAHRLIKNAKIRARIQQRIEDSLSVTDEEIIGTLTGHLRGHMSDLLDNNGAVDLSKLDEHGHLINSIEVKQVWEGTGKDKVPATITKVKLYNAQSAAEKLAKIRGMDNHPQRLEVSIDTDGLRQQLTKAVQYGLNQGWSLQDTLQYLTMRGVESEHLALIEGADLVFPESNDAIDITAESEK